MKKKLKKICKSEEGQALLEFALVLPLLLTILCGILDFGWLFYNQLCLDNAVREAARIVCVDSPKSATYNYDDECSKARAIVEGTVYNEAFLPDDGVQVIYLDDAGATITNPVKYYDASLVRVDCSLNMPVLTFVLRTFTQGDVKELNSSATFMVEGKGSVTVATTN